jgi:cobalt/nickel transport system permease protein
VFFIKKLLLVTPVAFLITFFILLSYFLEHKISLSVNSIFQYHPVYYTVLAMLAKIYISILAISIMISSTAFNDLLWGLRKFRLPRVVTTLSKLVYTYIFVFVDELHRTQRAYKSRTPVRRVPRMQLYGNIAATILLRSIDRSDIIYKAMVSRGYNGEFPEGNINHFKRHDTVAAAGFILLTAAAILLWNI